MADLNQFPNSTGFRKNNPTLPNCVVTKFQPKRDYMEKEDVKNEVGNLFMKSGVDLQGRFDIELLPLIGFVMPNIYQTLTFTAPTGNNSLLIPSFGGSTTLNVIVDGPIDDGSVDMGRVGRISFTGWVSTLYPGHT